MFQDISTLAEVTRLTEKLLYFLSKENAEGRYVSFKIKKKDGNLVKSIILCKILYNVLPVTH